ncbi:MAG: ribosome maturation protein [Methanobacterium sp.]|jgi:ribosome maturation protein SDO1|uniref:ribosome assembly factor SBDS n=1 Tax=Methanobacterium sp. TaxID=2164 RepID=UPI0003C94E12|nr:ribosome assembly factor SBDS [Methanobacterium sp.]MDI3550397.1 ribosome maturation protein [Methanobacterium sp.]CDG64656.1 Ribosome maturation protein SDO1 homolog [Methanobacterium sp. MB1]
MVTLEDAVIARLEYYGERFEVLVDPDLASDFKRGEDIKIEDILAVEEVFKDAKKGDKASEEAMIKAFDTNDPLEAAVIIIRKGQVQLTAQQRRDMQEDKRRMIVAKIAREAINPQTKLPHPARRIEIAMEEAKVKVDPFKSVDEQVTITLKAISRLIPIRFEKVKVAIHIPGEDTGKVYGVIPEYGKTIKEEWQQDGSWVAVVEIPGGMQEGFYHRLSEITHGQVETKLLK